MFGFRKQDPAQMSWLDAERLYLLDQLSELQLLTERLETYNEACARVGLQDALQRTTLALRLFSIRVLPLIGAVPKKNFDDITSKAHKSADIVEDSIYQLYMHSEEKGLDLSSVLTPLKQGVDALLKTLRLAPV